MRIILVEDHRATRQGISAYLGRLGYFVLAFASIEAARAADWTGVDAALVDLHLGRESGLDILPLLANAQIPSLMLTQDDSADQLAQAMRAGAGGYLLKHDSPASVVEALTALVEGGTPISPSMTRHLLGDIVPASPDAYSLVADLERGLATLQAPATGNEVEFRSDHTVSLLYSLGRHWLEDTGWIDDVALGVAVWGRRHRVHNPNNLNVLIHRVRKSALNAGLASPFLVKRAGRTQLLASTVVLH